MTTPAQGFSRGHSSRRRVRPRGFTAVEVLIAMTIMVIGAAAVMSMQKASIQGNLDARKTDIANTIARTWVERLRRDAMQWTPTAAEAIAPGTGNITLARLLGNVGGGWFLPGSYMGAMPESMSYGFDILGRDLPGNTIATSALFCTEVRLSWLVQNQLIRADVRVLWPRAIDSMPTGFCTVALPPNPETGAEPLYHAIYVTTAIGENPAQ